MVPHDPTASMLQAQIQSFMEKLGEDRHLQWQRGQNDLNRRLNKALNPQDAVPAEPDELRPAVVQEIFDEMVVDPARQLALRREERIRETLALHLEQLLTTIPPAALKQQPSSCAPLSRLRVISVQDRQLPSGENFAEVTFAVRPSAEERAESMKARQQPDATPAQESLSSMGPRIQKAVEDGDCSAVTAASTKAALLEGTAPDPLLSEHVLALERRLNAATEAISVALARRMMLSLSPRLVFRAEAAPSSSSLSSSPLWHVRRRERKLGIHSAARSWSATMHWS